MGPRLTVRPPRAWTSRGLRHSSKIRLNSNIFLVPSKTRKSDPMVAKSLPKWSPNPSPRHRKLELSQNCKSNENHCIYNVLNTSRRRILVAVHSQITKKTTLESALQFNGPYYEKIVKMTQKLVPRGSQNPSKIF